VSLSSALSPGLAAGGWAGGCGSVHAVAVCSSDEATSCFTLASAVRRAAPSLGRRAGSRAIIVADVYDALVGTDALQVDLLQIGGGAQSATEDAAYNFTVPAETFADVDAGDKLMDATDSSGVMLDCEQPGVFKRFLTWLLRVRND
jgi:hypothetical protein